MKFKLSFPNFDKFRYTGASLEIQEVKNAYIAYLFSNKEFSAIQEDSVPFQTKEKQQKQ